jgi:hypothetical protein
MPYSKTYIPGDRLVECDICGFTYRFSQMRRGVSEEQKGYIVGPKCFDPVHPNETPVKIRPPRPLPEVK